MKPLISSFLLLCLSCVTTAAHASLTCTSGASSILFGIYNPLSTTPLDSTGSVSISCDLTFPSAASKVTYSIALSSGASGAMLARAMQGTSTPLSYNLYTNNLFGAIWGDGSGGTAVVSGSMKLGSPGAAWSQTDTYTVYSRVAALQDVLPGSYADAIVVTVTY